MIPSNSQVVRYGNTALAAGALHSDMTIHGRQELQKIHRSLPPGAEVVVKFVVAADLNPHKYNSKATIYHAATVHMQKTPNNKFTVSATLGSYVDGEYQDSVQERELEAPSEDSSQPNPQKALTVFSEEKKLNNGSNEIAVYRHPLISYEHQKHLRDMGAINRCPQALIVMQAVHEIFKSGVPLPADQRFFHCTFTTMVRIPKESIQYLSVLSGTRGTMDPRKMNSASSGWWSTGVDSVTFDKKKPTNTDDPRGLQKRFEELTIEAQNGKAPLDIPSSAKPVIIGTMQSSTPSLRNSSGPKIEEIG